VQSLLEASFETIDESEEEQMFLLIQQALLKIVKCLNLPEESKLKVFEYLMHVLKKKSFQDADANYSY
jgi:hypothetical protein